MKALAILLLVIGSMAKSIMAQQLIQLTKETQVTDVSPMVQAGNLLFFTATAANTGTELWATDGTTIGTKLVKDIRGGAASSEISNLSSFGNLVIFTANDGRGTGNIWVSDGTSSGTYKLNIAPGTSSYSLPQQDGPWFVKAGKWGFLSLTSGSNSIHHFFRTDGTSAGTSEVYSVHIIPNGYGYNLSVVDTNVLVSKFDETRISKDDTVFVLNSKSPMKLLFPGSIYGTKYLPGTNQLDPYLPFFKFGNSTYFVNNNILQQVDFTLFFSTPMVGVVNPNEFTYMKNHFYFSAETTGFGNELWVADGTSTGTDFVKDINIGQGSSSPSSLTVVNGVLYFSADDGTHGRELWSFTPSVGIKMVTDMSPSGSSNVRYLKAFGNQLVFAADSSNQGSSTNLVSKLYIYNLDD